MVKTVQIHGFPTSVSAEDVKVFLETFTGTDTIHALKIGQSKGRPPRAFAIVQFTGRDNVEIITTLINKRLYYQGLKPARSSRLIFVWRRSNVISTYERPKSMEFLLTHNCRAYKIVFSYDSIWQIELRCPRGQKTKFLLIQVMYAPRIYEKPLGSSSHADEDQSLTYFKDTKDDQWVRTTDFTKSCIGQSSPICLELSLNCKLQGVRENFHYYKEDEGKFQLESGSKFSQSSDLVPIVNCLVQNGCLSGPTLDAAFYGLVQPQHVPSAYIEHALEKLSNLKECCYEPTKWLNEQYKIFRKSKHMTKPPVCLNDGVVYVRRVEITPTKVYFCGPEVIVSNRVLRSYHKLIDNFIRVSFVDEDEKKMWSTDLSPRTLPNETKSHTDVYRRVLSILRNDVTIGDKKFEFLAYSSSQLRDNSVWMFASENGITAAGIREWMGDFREIRNVAKYAARLGQSFSSSKQTLSVHKEEMEIISDVKIETDGVEYVFSDGIGKICPKFAQKVAKKCDIKSHTPSAFQIRYAGYKGVVAVDPTSVTKLSLRKSMRKYTSDNTELDVLSWSKFQPCFLNRQLITLLSTLGVQDQVFEKKQREAGNVNVLREMLMCGYKPDAEPYLSMMLQIVHTSKLLELRKKSRICISDGRSLMGCLDETRTLEYGQVFVQVSRVGRKQNHGNAWSGSDQHTRIVEGTVVVAKNPCLHPGDVRVLGAVNVPALQHMMDCVVFPQKGSRPHPNECSGSDLDSDIYFVSWDPELIPPRQIQPMDYT
ncbi:hypothetical protein AQUCO_06300045v1 [Aquilegia coerulea]|uniref:RNA-dependent RNA polymerase n=1 Tax=Aquilegia coerulea TaxID=218851 RepID=A0A2G5CCU9_AQUCA|nr:hypothetical protein AQUCO_06300045v1 [Aquilegia coerulea]